jgi:hypothetical protein
VAEEDVAPEEEEYVLSEEAAAAAGGMIYGCVCVCARARASACTHKQIHTSTWRIVPDHVGAVRDDGPIYGVQVHLCNQNNKKGPVCGVCA